MNTDHPTVFTAGVHHYVTNPTTTPEQVQSEIRRARRDQRRAEAADILALLTFALAIGGLVHGPVRMYALVCTAAAVGASISLRLIQYPHVGGSQNLCGIAALHLGTRATVAALPTASDPLTAHMALYTAAAHANAATSCAAQARRAQASDHHIDSAELNAEVTRLQTLARAALDEAHAACTGDSATPWALRVANRAIYDD